jgi:hypothetical protein
VLTYSPPFLVYIAHLLDTLSAILKSSDIVCGHCVWVTIKITQVSKHCDLMGTHRLSKETSFRRLKIVRTVYP